MPFSFDCTLLSFFVIICPQVRHECATEFQPYVLIICKFLILWHRRVMDLIADWFKLPRLPKLPTRAKKPSQIHF